MHEHSSAVVNGESAPYLGKEYRIEVTKTASGAVEFSRRFLIPLAQQKKRRQVLKAWYVERAKETILPLVVRHARDLGVDFGAARIVDNRYRWGSCTVKGNVNFDWRLIKAPMFVIAYVIVHELGPLLESNHTPRFWNTGRWITFPPAHRRFSMVLQYRCSLPSFLRRLHFKYMTPWHCRHENHVGKSLGLPSALF